MRSASRIFAALVAMVLVVSAGFAVQVLHPADGSDVPGIDAAFVFAGGDGARLARAKALSAERGVPLVLNDAVEDWLEGVEVTKALCRGEVEDVTAFCVGAFEDSTRGESLAFARLARERGMRRAVVVSDDYHLARAKRWLGKCFAGEIHTVRSNRRHPTLDEVVHEILGLWQAMLTVSVECDRIEYNNHQRRVS